MATPLPSTATLTTPPSSHAAMRANFANLRAFLAGLLGSDGEPATALSTLRALMAAHLTPSTATSAQVADRGKLFNCTGSWVLSLPVPSTAGAGWCIVVRNAGSGTITLTPASPSVIDGASTLALPSGRAVMVFCTGTTYWTLPFGTAALMAAQITSSTYDKTVGALLRVADFGLGATSSPVVGNLDDVALVNGWYCTTNTTLNTSNLPQAWGQLLVIRSVGRIVQLWFNDDTASARIAHRRSYNGSTGLWTPWRAIVDSGTIVGAVSQAAGVPTGAVIERGANANGEYVRWADGTQMCWHVITADNLASDTTKTADWTFPATFAGVPVATAHAPAIANPHLCWGACLPISATTANTSVRHGLGTPSTRTLYVCATGRWY